MSDANPTKPSKNELEMADLRLLLSAYSISDAIIAISAYVVLLAHMIDREHALSIALNQHKELLSRALLAFALVFAEFVYQAHLSLLYGVLRDATQIRVARCHKAFVALGSILWLLLAPSYARRMTGGIIAFFLINAIVVFVAPRAVRKFQKS